MQIGQLAANAGVVTPILGLAQCDANLLIGDVDTTMPLQGITIDVDGDTTINIPAPNQPLCSAFSKLFSQNCAGTVGLMFKVATGEVPKKTNIRLTNNGVTTPNIYFTSEGGNGVPIRAVTDVVKAAGQATYSGFSFLLITASANIQQLDFTFADGTVKQYAVVEADALFAMKNQTQADGRLDPVVTSISNVDQSIKSVRITATGADVTVLKVNVSDADWALLKSLQR